MHRTIQIALPSVVTEDLSDKLASLETVVGLSVLRGASVKPTGDVITIQVLNRGADDALRTIRETAGTRGVSITTHESASIIDREQEETIKDDVDEAIWEETETGLRHQGRITPNFISLMALSGAIASVGLISEPMPQAIAFAAAGIISPGFEPLAKLPLGIVLRKWDVVKNGFVSSLVGYSVVILAAAVVMSVLLWSGGAETKELTTNPVLESLAQPKLKDLIVAGAGAIAGILIIVAYRRSVIAGALIAVVLNQAAASIGAGLAASEWKIVGEGFERLAVDVLFIVVFGVIVFALKQFFVHRRQPIV